MTAKVLELEDVIEPDAMATRIVDKWITWDMLRNGKKTDWEEIRRYVYATDTTTTTNSQLPWKNKTTIPKLCQIRDNLYANYIATLFPKRKWLDWEANTKDSNSVAKRSAIINYMSWAINQPSFKHEMDKIILDYIEYGNGFGTVEWIDQRANSPNGTQVGYVGPAIRRINPYDIVFNPTTENFESSPKLVRSITSLGEVKMLLERLSNDENRAEYEELWKYLKDIRTNVANWNGDLTERDTMYQVDGFSSFRDYLCSDYAEIITFYGDLYDPANDTFLKNHVITVVDRHKVIGCKPNPSFFGYPPIHHVPWRKRQDNQWGMGPLDNLIGMQYRMDHVENMKADIMDLVTFPVQKVKGFVEDFTWQPGEKIYVSEEGDVDLVTPDVNVLQNNIEISNLERLMEEMAGAPREAMGFRTPGEKTKYEVQRLENASARLFQNKIKQFEEQILEPLLNAMLELAKRNLTSSISIRVFDDELKVSAFESLTVEDITGAGRIKPVAARHFAEQAELVQNLTTLSQSPLWQIIAPHVSSVQMAKTLETIFNIEDFGLVLPYVSITEQAEAQKLTQTLQEQVMMHAGTATGQGEDFDMEMANPGPPSMVSPEQLQAMSQEIPQ